MHPPIRIGTRDSELAKWQAGEVRRLLSEKGHSCTLIFISSAGDKFLDKPLYEMGIVGIFTKSLDLALLNGEIDVAVHSMKDVPTRIAAGCVQAAVLPRAEARDILALGKEYPDYKKPMIIATSSLRRKAQWLRRYPHHTVTDIRGNVNTRLKLLKEKGWDGAIFAQAGLERIQLLPKDAVDLNWMIPAPAQGAIMAVCRKSDRQLKNILSSINHEPSAICTGIEREFLHSMKGGCTAPIGALAQIDEGQIRFKACVSSPDGQHHFDIEKIISPEKASTAGTQFAQELLSRGADRIMAGLSENKNHEE